jgi:hypothetical protein
MKSSAYVYGEIRISGGIGGFAQLMPTVFRRNSGDFPDQTLL